MTTEREMRLRNKLLLAFELHEAGVMMFRARLLRENPALSADEIETRVAAWLQERPGAEFGDAIGTARIGWPEEKTP